jgi:hypothetical protein
MEFLGGARRWTVRWVMALMLGLGVWLATGTAFAQEASKEYQVKAAFLYNFVQFVKWPPDAFSSADAPLCIGILGDDPFAGALEDTVNGAKVDGHRLTVMHSHNIDDLRGCQLIFVTRSEEAQKDQILSAVASRPILTVSEMEQFAQNGGDIDFYLSNGKVRFEINPSAARRSGLKISSQLLALGRIVGGEN